jgi:hypothetical protein
VCDAVASTPVTVVPAGRAVGKSYLLAGLVLWWLYTRPNALVITTGPDHRQVVSVLWKEMGRAIEACARFGTPLGEDHRTKGYSSPQRLTVKDGTHWGALGFATKTEEGFGGQHAGELLVIVDEASGVPGDVWNAIHGLAATRLVIAGNPIRYDCHFRELHDLAVKGSGSIRSVVISSLECPDAAKETSPVGMASAAFLRQMREIHGESSPWWRSNILGQFPGEESVRFIPAAWLNACTADTVTADELWRDVPDGPARMGVDVGGGVGADRSVVVVRNDKQLLAVFASEWHGVLDDARQRLEPVILEMARQWRVEPSRVTYDKGGIVGRGLGSYLARYAERAQTEWREAHPDQFASARVGPYPDGFEGTVGYFGAGKGGTFFVNRRTANAFAVKRRLDPHAKGHVPFYCGGIAEWPALREELSELRTEQEREGTEVKQKLELKESMAARLKRSPDVLDAFLMTFNSEV